MWQHWYALCCLHPIEVALVIEVDSEDDPDDGVPAAASDSDGCILVGFRRAGTRTVPLPKSMREVPLSKFVFVLEVARMSSVLRLALASHAESLKSARY